MYILTQSCWLSGVQIQPGEYGTDGEAAVIANVDAALARFQHSTDPHVLELWSELCVHRAALRDGTSRTGGSAGTTVTRASPGPPLDTSAADSAERNYRGEHDTVAGTSPPRAYHGRRQRPRGRRS